MAEISLREAAASEIDWMFEIQQQARSGGFLRGDSQAKLAKYIADEDAALLVVVQDNVNVGFVLLNGLAGEDHSIELRRIIMENPGQGIGQQVIQLIKKYAFDQRDAARLWLDVLAHNKRAQHVYKKLGFVVEGTLRKALLLNQERHDLVIMSILDKEYITSRKVD